MAANKRSKHHNWKGGKIFKNGYRKILVKSGNSKKREYISEQKLVWLRDSEWHFIPEGFDIHHLNGAKLDNRIENLTCISHDIHARLHWIYEKEQNINRFKEVD